MPFDKIRFCIQCGSPVKKKVPKGDHLERYVCTKCGHVHYQNPTNIVGSVPIWEDKVLLCLRAIEPMKNYWTLPAGHQELGESTRDGALRETFEEAGISCDISQSPYVYIDLGKYGHSHIYYLARMTSLTTNPGIETFETKLFAENEIPWDRIAFNSVHKVLRLYFSDLKQGNFPFRYLEYHRHGPFP